MKSKIEKLTAWALVLFCGAILFGSIYLVVKDIKESKVLNVVSEKQSAVILLDDDHIPKGQYRANVLVAEQGFTKFTINEVTFTYSGNYLIIAE